MGNGSTSFGEWLKVRRLAAEMTPVDLARALGIEMAAYKAIEAGERGISEREIARLIKIEKMRITRRDVEHAKPKILAEADGAKPDAAAAVADAVQEVAKAGSAIDAIIASVQAKHAREASLAAKPRSPLAAFVRARLDELGIPRLELARRCKIAPTDLDDIEAGFVPGAATLRALAAGLGVEPAELEARTRG